MARDHDEQDQIGRYLTIGFFVIYPEFRKILFWCSLLGVIAGTALYFNSFAPGRVVNGPDGFRLFSMAVFLISAGLLVGLWLPSAIAAQAAKRVGLYDPDSREIADEDDDSSAETLNDETLAKALFETAHPDQTWTDLIDDDRDIWIVKSRRVSRQMQKH